MKINSTEVENYRNIEYLTADFDEVNIFYGENAQGKTNLTEALYLFTGNKSFRGVKDSELIRFGCDRARLKIDFVSKNRSQTAEIKIEKSRKATLNGVEKKSPSLLADEIKATVFSPSHLSMVKDGPIQRRKFIDLALCQIKTSYKGLIRKYKHCLTQRNILLKNISTDSSLSNMFYIWDRNLAVNGAKIIYQRQKYVEALFPYVKEIFGGLSNNKENIELKLKGSFDYSNLKTVQDIEKAFIPALEKNRENDILNKTTSIGPHRDDLDILINSVPIRNFGSQGQQRSCVLTLKLAEAQLLRDKTGEEPVALLDDVMSELDEKRQDYILNHIKNRQVFITCCDADTILRLKKGKTFHIKNGGLD